MRSPHPTTSPAGPAEIVRTLVSGHLPGLAHVPHCPVPLPVRHVTDSAGRPLILVRYLSAAADALWRAGDPTGTPIALAVADVPPCPDAPGLGRAWASGWGRPLIGDDARDAAVEFATTRPSGDLLALGRGFVLYRVEVAAVRWEPPAGSAVEPDPAEYAGAEPDPVHPVERALVAGLAGHHRGELAAMVHRLAPGAGTCGRIVTPVRIDRYGMLVDLADPAAPDGVPARRIRVDFPAPLSDPRQFVALLRPGRRPVAPRPARRQQT
ncbi:hypothetical protein GCM10023322_59600 [Rugosimonospora acidiphila]|uniref:DUF2470 domain-containing protein n=1 Tax=Rugosimonospora acidiphila TaxID=556531 RepID=A0ABP9SF31_9ACTN